MNSDIDLLVINSSKLLTLQGEIGLSPITGGGVAIKNGIIVDIGTSTDLKLKYSNCKNIIDAKEHLVMPGFVDCHTHLVFGGDRTEEMLLRISGTSYLDILKNGGGINSTVNATRSCTKEQLIKLSLNRLDDLKKHGTTTVEIKTGYGLNYESEKKMLEVIRELKTISDLDIVSTYLGAHTIPANKNREEYITWLLGESLTKFKNYAEFFDLFCEEGAFSYKESKELLLAAKKAGYKLKIHAGQFNDLEAPGMAAELGATSIDHLEHISIEQIIKMADKGTIAVLMPGVPMFLKTKYPNGRDFIDRGVNVALATDFNPGSCPSFSMPMMIMLAVFNCGLTIDEAIRAATINSAKAIGLQSSVGSLEIGKNADLIILNLKKPEEIVYYFGTNPVHTVIKRGMVI
ncbi:MAG: imidazolonepropionase [Spirochaetaceae bacterium]